ncbi:MAG: anti-sigma factor antagonist [Acutalibacteraceae bacterium]|nr:anti-sigma factor antagonist [Acutalibacteraceae bacterium]
MNVTYRIDKDILYIAVEGRIDASNADEAEEKIFNIKNDNTGKHIVVDADKLEYISSAGLRVILRLRKEEPKLAIINVAPDVYEVFDMTGFTDMVTVEKAYQRMSVEGCEFIAKGANGAVYRYDAETILKTYFAKDALPEIKQERENARKAFVLGINTAIPYGIVRVDDGYGTVTELLNATSVTKLIRQNPDDMTQASKYYIDMLKSIHALEVADGEVPDMKETALAWADFVAPHLPEEQGKKLRALVEAVPKQNTLMHGDYHTNNIMVQNGEPLLIDMDTLCMGHPVFELGSMFNAFIGYSELDHQVTMDFFGYTHETAEKFWDMSLKMYLGTEDEEVCRNVAEKAMIIGYTRMLRRAVRRPNEADSPAKIARCKEMLEVLLNKVDTLVF